MIRPVLCTGMASSRCSSLPLLFCIPFLIAVAASTASPSSPELPALHRSRLLLAHSPQRDASLVGLDKQVLGLYQPQTSSETPSDIQRVDDSRASSNTSRSTVSSSDSSCEATYGVLPCTDTVIGNIFLLAAYGYLLFLAARMLSEGSELLLTVLDAGIIGGLLLPILGALPDSILILVSGLGGTQAEAQEQVLVGIGLLAGSIVMLLTLLWGSCLFLGRCDLEKREDGNLTAKDKVLTKKWNFTETGVETDDLTMMSARIMILSVIPFIVAQLPKIFNFSADGNIPVLVACIISVAGLLAYCLYQVFTPWMVQRRREVAQHRVNKLLALERVFRHADHQNLVNSQGTLNEHEARRLFDKIDADKDGKISPPEIRTLVAVTFRDTQADEESMRILMRELDLDKNNSISKEEFLIGMSNWCRELKLHSQHSVADERRKQEEYLNALQLIEEDEEDEDGDKAVAPTKKQIIKKAVLLLLGGTIIAAVFADPLVDAVNAFSSASSIPSFFISFVLLPVASNSSEGVSSIIFAGRKKKKIMSLTYSQIYGGVTINSTMGLGIFLAMVYARGLVWDFSSEVLVICLVTLVMGLMASFRRVFPAWTAFIALSLYPVSLGLVAILDYVAGWE